MFLRWESLFCGESSFLQGTVTLARGEASRKGQTPHLLRFNPSEPLEKREGGEVEEGQEQDLVPCGDGKACGCWEMSCGSVSRIARQRGLPGAPPEVSSLLRGSGRTLDIESDVMVSSEQPLLSRAQALSCEPH